MIRALLVIWAMDPTGSGSVTIQPQPTLEACYAHMEERRACVPAEQVATLMRTLTEQGCRPVTSDGQHYECHAKVSP